LSIKIRKKIFEKAIDKTVSTVYTVNVQLIYRYTVKNVQEVSVIFIFIDNKNGEAIYSQIYSQIKENIISGKLKENEPLPSIRSLAKDLQISVITTKRAYDELEKNGFIYTRAGKGCFVARQNTDRLREENLKKIENHILEIIKLKRSTSLTTKDIVEMFRIMEEEI